MSAQNWEACLQVILAHEGGYVDNPADPGGATNLGITKATYERWIGRKVTKAEVRSLKPSDAKPIYKSQYWDEVQGDVLPSGLDLALFDYAVNSGPSRATIALQRILKIADDGQLGPRTLEAVRKHNPQALINKLCDERLAFLKKLRNWRVFGKGWGKRVAAVREQALKLAQQNPPSPAIRTIDVWGFVASLFNRGARA